MMRIAVVCFVLSLAGLNAAAAQTAKITGVTINTYGIYTANQVQKRPEAQTATGNVNILDNFKLEKQTETIPGQQGLRFGVSYVINGRPRGKEVTLTMKTIFPAPGITRPTGEHFDFSKFDFSKKIGETTYRTYTFDNDWEIVPGDWTFEFYDGDRKIAEKRFRVVMP